MEMNEKAMRKANEIRLADLSFKNAIDFLENAISTATLQNGETIEVDMIKEVLGALYYNARLCMPYKVEDLKHGMWIYDVVEKTCLQIIDFYKGDMVCQSERCPDFGVVIHFEENRFYPVFTFNDLLKGD